MKLSALDILSRKPTITEVNIELLGGTVFIKELTVETRMKFVEAKEGDKQLVAIISCVCDEQGEPMFTINDIDALRQLSYKTLESIFTEVMLVLTSKNEKQAIKK